MTSVSLYLNFSNNTEQAFEFYRSVFGGEFEDGIHRLGEAPQPEGKDLSEADKNLVLHVCLPILGGMKLMGTDAPESMGFKMNMGNNIYINLEPDTRSEADRLFNGLSVNGKIESPMGEVFWGAYYGAFFDQFGVQWMINYTAR